jgi:hypothetical protein
MSGSRYDHVVWQSIFTLNGCRSPLSDRVLQGLVRGTRMSLEQPLVHNNPLHLLGFFYVACYHGHEGLVKCLIDLPSFPINGFDSQVFKLPDPAPHLTVPYVELYHLDDFDSLRKLISRQPKMHILNFTGDQGEDLPLTCEECSKKGNGTGMRNEVIVRFFANEGVLLCKEGDQEVCSHLIAIAKGEGTRGKFSHLLVEFRSQKNKEEDVAGSM